MSIRKGNRVIAGSAQSPMDLFDFKWADHICNDIQWLRADTFSWQSGSVYQAAYNELFYDIQISTYWYSGGGPAYTKSRTPAAGDAVYLNSDLTTQIGTVDSYDGVNDEITVSGDTYTFMSNTYVTPTTETVAGYSLSIYTGHSGRKIVSAGDETKVANIYTATGVAWYYIIDIPNKRFKLPRTKFGFTGLRDTVGNYVAPGLPDHNHSITTYNSLYPWAGNSGSTWQGTKAATTGNASASNPIYGNSDTVQPPATQMYLYFYVGQFTQSALENTAGITAETINDLGAHIVTEVQLPNAGNNYIWYRKYADGWVEQGGITNDISVAGNSGTNVNVTLPITMADTNYNILTTRKGGGSGYAQTEENTNIISTSVIRITLWNNVSGTASGGKFWWEVKGMAA